MRTLLTSYRDPTAHTTLDSGPQKLREITDRLERRGYIVNDFNSLRTGSKVLGTRKPKVFLRPRTAEVRVTASSQPPIVRTSSPSLLQQATALSDRSVPDVPKRETLSSSHSHHTRSNSRSTSDATHIHSRTPTNEPTTNKFEAEEQNSIALKATGK